MSSNRFMYLLFIDTKDKYLDVVTPVINYVTTSPYRDYVGIVNITRGKDGKQSELRKRFNITGIPTFVVPGSTYSYYAGMESCIRLLESLNSHTQEEAYDNFMSFVSQPLHNRELLIQDDDIVPFNPAMFAGMTKPKSDFCQPIDFEKRKQERMQMLGFSESSNRNDTLELSRQMENSIRQQAEAPRRRYF